MNENERSWLRMTVTGVVLLWTIFTATAQSNLTIHPALPYLASAYARGPFQPVRSFYVLSNSGPEVLSWVTVKMHPWFSVSETGGVLEPGEASTLKVFPNSQALRLPAGFYESAVIWVDQTHGETFQTSVQLEVSVPGAATLEELDVVLRDALELTFTGQPGTEFLLETTQNFEDWSLIQSNVFSSESAVYREDLTNVSERFFRVRSQGDEAVPARLTLANVIVQDPQKLRLTGDAGGTYLVEFSTNRSDWVAWHTNQLPSEGSVVFTNEPAVGGETYSYRATALDAFQAPVAHHVLVTGQSLAVGVGGNPSLSTEASDRHFRFFSDGSNFITRPLQELGIETIMTSSANQVSSVASNHSMVMSLVGLGSADYDQLKKGTALYKLGLQQFQDGAHGMSSVIRDVKPSAIFVVHGEADHLNPDYDLDVREWQADFEKDIRNVTGQNVPIPMFHSQVSSWPRFGAESGQATTIGGYELLAESVAHPDRTVLVCPKYMFPYGDGIHLTNRSYQWLGEYYGKVYRKVVVDKESWSPLRPLSIVRTNNLIRVRFHVPVPPLVLDTDLVSNPGHFGFEYWNDGGAPPPILGVRLAGADTIELALVGLPSNVNERLRYAYTGIPGNWAGPTTGPRGNLRDSDPEPSLHGNTLYNWCVHFDEPIVAAP